MTGLRRVAGDQQLAVLRILADRRRSLGEDHTRMVSQLHQLLPGLIPGGAKKDLSAAQARALLARVRPRDAAGKARRRVAAELISDLERTCQRKKDANKELSALLRVTGTTLTVLHGMGPSGAARLLAGVGAVTRFPGKAHFASWDGTAPIDASSGDQVRHRLPGPATGRSTGCCTSWPWSGSATPPRAAPTLIAKSPPGKRPGKRCAPSNAGSPTSPATR
jgi:transposase